MLDQVEGSRGASFGREHFVDTGVDDTKDCRTEGIDGLWAEVVFNEAPGTVLDG